MSGMLRKINRSNRGKPQAFKAWNKLKLEIQCFQIAAKKEFESLGEDPDTADVAAVDTTKFILITIQQKMFDLEQEFNV